ncbi:MAG: Rha family transcriptional regulator [Mailhella sp.]|nr:Rha family transcriptional regulator [Mailhella sp.]
MNNLVSQAGLPNFGDTPKNLVQQNNNGTITTTSLRIAEIFGKRHDHILRDIENLIEQMPEEMQEEWGDLNFEATCYINDQNRQFYPMYKLTRDAFTLLAMGFTGEKALRWKLKFIEAFNAMEQDLLNKEINSLKTIADHAYNKGRQEGLREDNWRKMEKAVKLLRKGISLADAAKIIGCNPDTIRERLQRLGVWEKVKNDMQFSKNNPNNLTQGSLL